MAMLHSALELTMSGTSDNLSTAHHSFPGNFSPLVASIRNQRTVGYPGDLRIFLEIARFGFPPIW